MFLGEFDSLSVSKYCDPQTKFDFANPIYPSNIDGR